MPRSKSQPDPPTFFVDRSLGKHRLPDGLRSSGLVVETLASYFGEVEAQSVADEVWLTEAGRSDWVVLTKDERIRRRPAELAAVQRHAVRVFCLTSASLTGEQQVERFVTNRHRMLQRAKKPGPWICGVYEDRIATIWP